MRDHVGAACDTAQSVETLKVETLKDPKDCKMEWASPWLQKRKWALVDLAGRRRAARSMAPEQKIHRVAGSVFSSHWKITSAIASEFFSCIMLWLLPRMPRSASLIQVGVTPAWFRNLTMQWS
jgi:hypothetical protein